MKILIALMLKMPLTQLMVELVLGQQLKINGLRLNLQGLTQGLQLKLPFQEQMMKENRKTEQLQG